LNPKSSLTQPYVLTRFLIYLVGLKCGECVESVHLCLLTLEMV
jgi:hypothetical protein